LPPPPSPPHAPSAVTFADAPIPTAEQPAAPAALSVVVAAVKKALPAPLPHVAEDWEGGQFFFCILFKGSQFLYSNQLFSFPPRRCVPATAAESGRPGER